MKQITIHITIGKTNFYFVDTITINGSWNYLADTAVITLPRKLFKSGDLAKSGNQNPLIKTGDPVTIRLGYDFDMYTEFTGYVKSISPNTPVKIECEDEMWLLKQTSYTQAWRSASLKDILDVIIPSSIDVQTTGEVNLGKFRINQVSAFDVLKKIKEVYGLVSYMRGKTLFIGYPYQEKGNKVKLDFQENIDDEQTNLTFRTSDQVKLKFKAISIQSDGSKREVELGDPSGQLRTLHLPVGLNEQEIQAVAEQKMKLYNFDGYQGTVTTFGQPIVRHTDKVEFINNIYPDKEGTYFIDNVQVKLNGQGYRRTLTIGNQTN